MERRNKKFMKRIEDQIQAISQKEKQRDKEMEIGEKR